VNRSTEEIPVADKSEAFRPGQEWEAILKATPESFATFFTSDVSLEASVLSEPLRGPRMVRTFFGATSRLYESLIFSHEFRSESKTYLEWTGLIFGGSYVAGITILTHDAKGLIQAVSLHHRPLRMVLKVSRALASTLSESQSGRS
jgi:hypothetical protein